MTLNPEHVENLNTLSELKKQGFSGSDASLNESLTVYGLAWCDLGEEWLFIYKIPGTKNRFDRCTFKKTLDSKKEWDWIKWGDLLEFCGYGVNDESFFARDLPLIVADLIAFYGILEIMGESYWQGFKIEGLDFE